MSLGGAINEKQKDARDNPLLSRQLHAAFGLDHYPNYLLKWQLSDIEQLEGELEAMLAKVRQQKALKVLKEQETSLFESTIPLSPSMPHQELAQAIWHPEVLALW